MFLSSLNLVKKSKQTVEDVCYAAEKFIYLKTMPCFMYYF